jgi:histidine phosphotransfer protein HptB
VESDIRARLAEITGGAAPAGPERELLARLLTSYTSKTLTGIDQLETLIRGGDPVAVRDQAHALKGSAGNLGITSMATLFAGIEHAARDGHLPDPALTEVRAAYAEVVPLCTGIAAAYCS